MKSAATLPSPSAPTQFTPATDITGRDRMSRNVAFAWGGYMVNVVTGFIVPRLISDQLGQATLGIWDFSWSIVSYFGLVQLGLGSSVSRYVAKYRSTGDFHRMNVSVSTVAFFQRCVGWIAAALAAVTALWVLPLFGERLAGELGAARWVVFILGLEIAASINLTAYGSVIVGCHRWDIHNTISAVSYGLIALGMTSALLLGGSLITLALIHCLAMTAGDLVRCRLSQRICPELQIRRELASKAVFLEQARYSGKSLLPQLSALISNQIQSLLIVAFLGAPSLAVFSRPRSLIRTLQTLAAKFGFILIPTASAMSARKDRDGLRSALLDHTAFISAVSLPLLVTIGVFGDHLILIWMGPSYIFPGLVPVLALGAYGTLVQEPIWSLLSGMNGHGRAAYAKLAAALASTACLAIGLIFFNWNLLGAASCFIFPQLLIDGIYMPYIACKRMDVSIAKFWRSTIAVPALSVLPLTLGLMFANHWLISSLTLALSSALAGSAASTFLYWKYVIPPKLRERIANSARSLTA